MKKVVIIGLSLVLNLINVFSIFAYQVGETNEWHYYKATVPFRTGDLQKFGAYNYIGKELNDSSDISTNLVFDGDGRDWGASYSIGGILKTGDERYRDVICVFKQKTLKEKFGPHIVATLGERWGMKYCISCNHNVSRDDNTAIVDEDYCDFEEISEEVYYEYLPRSGARKNDNNNEDIYYYENNIQKTGWNKDSGGTRYYDLDTGKAVYGWQEIGGNWYYFMPGDCYMVKNRTIDGHYINNKGICNDYDKDYEDYDDYSFEIINNKNSGWVKNTEGWKYYDKNTNSPVSGWKQISNDWYYFLPETCIMQTNTTIDGYYVDNNGKWNPFILPTGWQQDSKGWKYYDLSTHQICTGWKQIDNAIYYFDNEGYMALNKSVEGHMIGDNGKVIQ